MSSGFSHRSTLKQSNKAFKSKHASKGTLKDRAKGRTEGQAARNIRNAPSTSTTVSRKADRRNAARIEQLRKRSAAVAAARFFAAPGAAPKIVAVVPLCPDIDSNLVVQALAAANSLDDTLQENFNSNDILEDDSKENIVNSNFATILVRGARVRLQLLPAPRHLLAILDAVRVADAVVFALSANTPVDAFGESTLAAIRAQGVPAIAPAAILHLDDAAQNSPKKAADIRKSILAYLAQHFPGDHKLFSVPPTPSSFSNTHSRECTAALRSIATMRPKGIAWRDRHAYILADNIEFIPNDTNIDPNVRDDADVGTMCVTGFVRGSPLSANRLIHIQDHGDFQIGKIVRAAEPWAAATLASKLARRTTTTGSTQDVSDAMAIDMDDASVPVTTITATPIIKKSLPGDILDLPDPNLQESLVSENTPDPMSAEQTWPTEDELAEADARVRALRNHTDMDHDDDIDQGGRHAGPFSAKKTGQKRRVPKGTSSYQAAWILDDDEDNDEEVDADVVETTDGNAVCRQSSGARGNQVIRNNHHDDDDMDDDEDMPSFEHQDVDINDNDRFDMNSDEEDDDGEEDDYEEVDVEEREADTNTLDATEEKRQLDEYLARQRQIRDDAAYPDEIDTPQHIPARERFARYRGLKSFRTSAWDAYENLPEDYGRIFRFANEKRTRRRVMMEANDAAGGVVPGTYVTVHLVNVPRRVAIQHTCGGIRAVFSLLPHEHKMTVVNMVVQRVGGEDSTGAASASASEIVKSKDRVVVMSGFRRYDARPVYSTYTRGGVNNVHKYERFLHVGRATVATMYAPVQFGPAPVLMFVARGAGNATGSGADTVVTNSTDSPSLLVQSEAWMAPEMHESDDGMQTTATTPSSTLIATGSIMDMDALRIIAKRIVLTGHPFKVHRRVATIRYMFYTPEDVTYFKPVAIHTKHGRVGHIKESLGTHGYMKCEFDDGIKAHDTVCMSLYKRVFPKWNTRAFVQSQ